MRLLPAIVANLFLVASALGFGSVLRPLFPSSFSTLDRAALTLLGGIGLLGTLLFDIGQAWFSRPAIALIMLTGIFLDCLSLTRIFRKPNPSMSKTGVPLLTALIVAGVLLVTAVAGLAEPTGDIKMDAMAYHFLGPKVWLREGTIRPVLDEAFTAFPAIVETQYAALMAFGGPRAPGFFSFISLLSIFLVTGALALRSDLSSSGAWWVAALVCTMPVVYRGAYGGFVDVIYSGFVLAAARVGFDAERPVHYVLFGLFCGFAMGTKYTGLIAVALLFACAFYLVIMVHGQDKKSTLKHLAIAAAVAAAVAGPWYIRNWILLGCPIYPPPPVLLRFFHVEQHLPREGIERLVVRMWTEGRGMGRGPLTFLLLPFHLTYHPANFINGAGGIGLAPLAFAPFGLLVCRKNSFAKALALFALLSMAAWFVTAQEARYLIHGYLIATIFAVWGWRYVVRTAPRFAPALSGVLLGVSISYGLFMIASMNKEDLHAVLSPSFENKRKRDEIPFLDAFEYLNRARSVDKVLVLNPRVPTYYLDKTYLKPIGRWGEQTLPEGDKLSQILSELPRLHISHIMDVRLEGTDFRLPEHPQGLTLVFERADQRVYRAE